MARPLLPLTALAIAMMACATMGDADGFPGAGQYEVARRAMVADQIEARGVRDPRVLAAMRDVPRHLFVPAEEQKYAYHDYPLAIGFNQTISQPYIVALMTELARPAARDRALEVGTGSGYQAAVLSTLVARVFSIEVLDELASAARDRLARLGYANVTVRHGDGYAGWPDEAPFEVILVTAAPDTVPEPLVRQLAPGGRMVIPVGPASDVQDLILIEKDASGQTSSRSVIPVRFVPLIRREGRGATR